MIPSEEEVDRLEKFVGLLQEAVMMKDDLAECLDTLKELQQFTLPTSAEIQTATEQLATLEAIQELQEV